LPDSQAGHFRSFELRTFLASNDKQDNSSDQRQPAEYRRNGNSVLSLCRNMHWSHIHYMFVTGVVESVMGEDQPAQNNQENSCPNDGFISIAQQLNSPSSALNQVNNEDGQRH